jgi:fumarate reductase (CoM/CoB) subunit B
MSGSKAKVTVLRYNPEQDAEPKYETYSVPFQEGITVLDALIYIHENYDSTLAFRYDCRYGHCGSCAIDVNGEPVLACGTLASRKMTIKPLSNLPILRDLVVDRTCLTNSLLRARLFLERGESPSKEPEKLLPKEFSTFRIVSRCINCLSCMSKCPTYTEAKHLYIGPCPIAEIARYAFDPRNSGDKVMPAYQEGLFNCTLCRKCAEVCPYEINLPELVMIPLRGSALKSNMGPIKDVEGMAQRVKTTGNVLMKPLKATFLSKSLSTVSVKNPKDRIMLFVGCLFDYDYRLHNVCNSAINVLKSNQIEVAIPKDQVCCGLPFIQMGYFEPVKEHLLKRNLRIFEKFQKVVGICAGCVSTLKNWYPKISKEIEENYKVNVFDINEFLVKYGWRTDLMGELNLRVTYHDPCELNRGCGISKEPRDLIKSIPGVKLVEMDEPDLCCGGTLKMLNSKLGYKIASRKADMIKMLNVDAVATACPRCMTQLSSALSMKGARNVKVLHVVQLLDMACNIKQRINRIKKL